MELAASVDADEADRIWFRTRVADSIESIRDVRAFEVARTRGHIHPTAQDIAQNQQLLVDARREIFGALQDLILVTRYLFLREA